MFVKARRVVGLTGVMALCHVAMAQAALAGPDGAVHGCVAKNGALTLIAYRADCPKQATSITLGKAGAQGPGGAPGPAGAAADPSQLNTLNSEVSALQSQVGTLKSQISALQTDDSTLQSDVANLQSDNSALQATFGGVTRTGDLLTFSGMNVEINSGTGQTDAEGDTGNLFIGYNEHTGVQTGSNNLVIGDHNVFTSYADLIAGNGSYVSAPYAAVLGGDENNAEGEGSVVTGGLQNVAFGADSTVSGGEDNDADGQNASVTGGQSNIAYAADTVVAGGSGGLANDIFSSILGGCGNITGPGTLGVCTGVPNGYEAILGGFNHEVTTAGGTSYTGP